MPLGEEPITSFFQRARRNNGRPARESTKRKRDSWDQTEANPKQSKTDKASSTHSPVRRPNRSQLLLTDFVISSGTPPPTHPADSRSSSTTLTASGRLASRRAVSPEKVIDLTEPDDILDHAKVELDSRSQHTYTVVSDTARSSLPKARQVDADQPSRSCLHPIKSTPCVCCANKPPPSSIESLHSVSQCIVSRSSNPQQESFVTSLNLPACGIDYSPLRASFGEGSSSILRTTSRDSSLESLAPFKSLRVDEPATVQGVFEAKDPLISDPDGDFVPSSQPHERDESPSSQYFIPSSQTQMLEEEPHPPARLPSAHLPSPPANIASSQTSDGIASTLDLFAREDPISSSHYLPSDCDIVPSSQTQLWNTDDSPPPPNEPRITVTVWDEIVPSSQTQDLQLGIGISHDNETAEDSEVVPTSQIACEQELSISTTVTSQPYSPLTPAPHRPFNHERSSRAVLPALCSPSTSISQQDETPSEGYIWHSAAYGGDTEASPCRPIRPSTAESEHPLYTTQFESPLNNDPSSASSKNIVIDYSQTQMSTVSDDFGFSLGSEFDVGGTQIIRTFCEMFADGRRSPEVLSLSQI